MSESVPAPKAAQQFTISLEGGDLPREVADRIHRALHRAVLQELADIDLAASNAVRFLAIDELDIGGGHTQGLRAEIFQR